MNHVENAMKTPIILMTASFVFFAGEAFAQSEAAVSVKAWAMHHGGKLVYRYAIQNRSSVSITRVLIGHYPSKTNGRAELSIPPASSDDGLYLWSDVASRPNGWGVRMEYAEESTNFSLEWVEGAYFKKVWPAAPPIVEGPAAVIGNNAIPPGATWDNFSITVPEADAGFVDGHASIVYGDKLINVPIQKGDTIAPNIMLGVERVNQNEDHGHWAIFNVRASATDNYDPVPTLVFDPVHGNQPLRSGDVAIDGGAGHWKIKLKNVAGRTYRLQVSSTDASGNTSKKFFEYTMR